MENQNVQAIGTVDPAKARVEQELSELSEKIVKLTSFLYSQKCMEAKISQQMIYYMKDQLESMKRYAELLQKRLEIWGKTDKEIHEDTNAYFA